MIYLHVENHLAKDVVQIMDKVVIVLVNRTPWIVINEIKEVVDLIPFIKLAMEMVYIIMDAITD